MDKKWRGQVIISLAVFVALTAILGYAGVALPRRAAATSLSWSQDAHDAQRTGSTSEEPSEPWSLAWEFNADTNGGTNSSQIVAPTEARTVAGGGNIYDPLGSAGLYGLSEQTGAVLWHDTSTSYNAAPAYDPTTGYLLAGGYDGNLYEFDGQTGTIVGTINLGSPIEKAILIVGSYAFVVSDDGVLHKVAISDLTQSWSYAGGARPGTMPAYSSSRDIIIYATDNASGFEVHAVNNSDGTRKWMHQPSIDNGSNLKPVAAANGEPAYNVPDNSWPVIAEQHGIVFIWMQLYDYNDAATAVHPGSGSTFPAGAVNGVSGTNAQVRSWLQSNPQYQSYFALSLDTGGPGFTMAEGFSANELALTGALAGNFFNVFGQMPVIKVWPNGDEVAYMYFRNGACAATLGDDWRWDGNLGEMVLDSTTVSGLNAGDYRFVSADNGLCAQMSGGTSAGYFTNGGYLFINDERSPLTMAGDTTFYAHWGASEAYSIVNRSASLGMNWNTPISSAYHPPVLRSLDTSQSCNAAYSTSHVATCDHLTRYNDARSWAAASSTSGWAAYWNTEDPPPYPSNGHSQGTQPHYTYVSDGYLVVEDNAGGLMVFRTSEFPYTVTLSPVLK